MPGVPPDALAQVKRGLRGLFSRKKRDKSRASGSNSRIPSNVGTDASMAGQSYATAAGNNVPGQGGMTDEGDKSIASATPDTLPPDPTPHISEPAGVSDAQKIDINPSATTAAETSVSNAPTDEASIIPSTKTITGGGATRADSKDIPAGLENAHNMDDNSLPVLVAKPPAEGMSATSGPLEDSFHAEYTGVDDEEDLTGRVEIQEVGGAPVNELESGVGHDGGNIAEGEGTEEQARRDETTIQSRGEEGVETAETQATDTAT